MAVSESIFCFCKSDLQRFFGSRTSWQAKKNTEASLIAPGAHHPAIGRHAQVQLLGCEQSGHQIMRLLCMLFSENTKAVFLALIHVLTSLCKESYKLCKRDRRGGRCQASSLGDMNI
jgi:hypothetical protein